MARKQSIELNPETPAYALYRDQALPMFNKIDLFLFSVASRQQDGTFTYLQKELPQVVDWLRELQELGRSLITHLATDGVYDAVGLLLIDKRIRFYMSRLKRLVRGTARFFYID
ncbi:hypothetical protein [Burkholderia pseudomallei]|uniref:hypothetical protein n=1 Tax=Burkholderia pseudomallei TaxID=28450 RepID=UPI00193D604B|nr:hypothetical protein [Burkholderia pseudomallei]QRM23558.1 hypothetical protein JQX71_04535 [Burkholderia pseudomallei]